MSEIITTAIALFQAIEPERSQYSDSQGFRYQISITSKNLKWFNCDYLNYPDNSTF
ncbi:MAG: hypothetical protein KME31_15870 [Tolypothrix carrinoi HA7290-LM1]|nr:hypothetical protein [Tolypothrix carrinoi HA7290-LM1]